MADWCRHARAAGISAAACSKPPTCSLPLKRDYGSRPFGTPVCRLHLCPPDHTSPIRKPRQSPQSVFKGMRVPPVPRKHVPCQPSPPERSVGRWESARPPHSPGQHRRREAALGQVLPRRATLYFLEKRDARAESPLQVAPTLGPCLRCAVSNTFAEPHAEKHCFRFQSLAAPVPTPAPETGPPHARLTHVLASGLPPCDDL